MQDLSVTFPHHEGRVKVVSSLDLELAPGETVGIVGESGSGKTMTVLSLLGLVPNPGRVETTSSVQVCGVNIYDCEQNELRKIRGGKVGTVFQSPAASMNPVLTVGEQISETILAHEDVTRGAAQTRSLDLMSRVGLDNPGELYGSYPHSFSGGMLQRIAIAMALACNPEILLADEPTTALDVTVQAQIIGLLRGLVDEMGMALVLVSHDLGVVNQLADRTVIMYLGEVMETGSTRRLLSNPSHPYTRGLLGAIPQPGRSSRARPIPGRQPPPHRRPTGCVFHPRCSERFDKCLQQGPVLKEVADGHECACWAASTPVS